MPIKGFPPPPDVSNLDAPVSAIPVFSNYEWAADLAAGTTYTPPTKTLFVVSSEGLLDPTKINVEMFDSINTSWAVKIDASDKRQLLAQSDAQNIRIINDDGSNRAAAAWGFTWA